MPILTASFSRDANSVPIIVGGLTIYDVQTLTGNNGTIAVPIFGVTGIVEIRQLSGVVTTVLGANHTAAYWRLNDQTAQVSITASSGTTLSGIAAGSIIVKKDVASAALTLLNNSAGRISEPTTLETTYFSPFLAVKKTGAVTNIEYVYTTTDAPTSGVIQFFCKFIPVSVDGVITAL